MLITAMIKRKQTTSERFPAVLPKRAEVSENPMKRVVLVLMRAMLAPVKALLRAIVAALGPAKEALWRPDQPKPIKIPAVGLSRIPKSKCFYGMYGFSAGPRTRSQGLAPVEAAPLNVTSLLICEMKRLRFMDHPGNPQADAILGQYQALQEQANIDGSLGSDKSNVLFIGSESRGESSGRWKEKKGFRSSDFTNFNYGGDDKSDDC